MSEVASLAATLAGKSLNSCCPVSTPSGSGVSISCDSYFQGTGEGTDAANVFIIQISGNLIQAANFNMILQEGTKAENLFWQVTGKVKVGAGRCACL
jgi:hypothetical protein